MSSSSLVLASSDPLRMALPPKNKSGDRSFSVRRASETDFTTFTFLRWRKANRPDCRRDYDERPRKDHKSARAFCAHPVAHVQMAHYLVHVSCGANIRRMPIIVQLHIVTTSRWRPSAVKIQLDEPHERYIFRCILRAHERGFPCSTTVPAARGARGSATAIAVLATGGLPASAGQARSAAAAALADGCSVRAICA